MITDRPLPIQVAFSQKERVKTLGAQWDATHKTWFIPAGTDTMPFAQWMPIDLSNLPFKTLYVDLVPASTWAFNVRKLVSAKEWAGIQQFTFDKAHHHCECCHGKGRKHPVECHERWSYDKANQIQMLVETIALCPPCHESTHIGLAGLRGNFQRAFQHLKKVNHWTDDQTRKHIHEADLLFQQRSRVTWALDLSFLLRTGVQFSDRTLARTGLVKPDNAPPIDFGRI
jgi:hypothetical protein